MKIQLIPEKIVENVSDEEQLSDNVMDAIYDIRKLKAAVMLAGVAVEVKEPTDKFQQIFIDQFDIWFDKEEYQIVEVIMNGIQK